MGVKLVEMREEMTKVLTDVKELRDKEERTADDESKLDQLLARSNELGPEILREKAIDDAAKQLDDYTKPATNGRVSAFVSREDGKEPKNKPTPMANYGRRFVQSEAYREYKDQPRGKGQRFDIHTTYNPLLEEMEADQDLEQRTLVYTGATASLVLPGRQPGIYGPPLMPFQVRMRDVLTNSTTDSNAVQYVREGAFTNAAAETAEAVSTVTGAKPESALTFTVVTTNVATIAHWIPITRQVIDDAGQMETYVNGRLMDGLRLREDLEIVAGDGTGANLTGLMSTSGIGNLDAAYWTANPLPTTGAAANKVDRIRRAKKYIAVTGLATASFIVLHPDDLEIFDELKDTTGKYVMADPINYGPLSRPWAVTVVESTSITANNFLIGDGRFAAIFDKMDAQVFVADQHSDFFIRNIFVILAEERLALAVFRPSAFAKGVFA